MNNIKVQIIGKTSINAQINSKEFPSNPHQEPITFIAYSNTMKSRVLEMLIEKKEKIGVSFTRDKVKDGEWHESFNPNAVFNDQEITLRHIDTITVVKDLIDRLENSNAIEFISEEQKQKLINLLFFTHNNSKKIIRTS